MVQSHSCLDDLDSAGQSRPPGYFALRAESSAQADGRHEYALTRGGVPAAAVVPTVARVG